MYFRKPSYFRILRNDNGSQDLLYVLGLLQQLVLFFFHIDRDSCFAVATIFGLTHFPDRFSDPFTKISLFLLVFNLEPSGLKHQENLALDLNKGK